MGKKKGTGKGGSEKKGRRNKKRPPSLTGDLTVTQAAAELGCCEKTLREKFIWTGLLRARRQGRAYRIARADLEAFRAQGKLAWEAERRALTDEDDDSGDRGDGGDST